MTKKDRAAISISIILFLLATVWGSSIGKVGNLVELFFLLVTPYWAYRFIKNDISFLRRNPKTTNDKNNIGAIDSKADALLKWNELLAKGAITQEEYDKAKRDLLS
jgi:hypothetical protein